MVHEASLVQFELLHSFVGKIENQNEVKWKRRKY